MKEINDKLDNISGLITRIDAKILEINSKLEELIKALHDYDDDLSYEPQSGPCSKHDEASWDEERMNIIGQNGNEGTHYDSHYVSNEEADEDAEFSDYGMRIAKEVMSDKDNVRVGKDKSNNSDKHNTVVEKKRNNGRESGLKAMGEEQPKQKRYYKNNRSKRNDNKK